MQKKMIAIAKKALATTLVCAMALSVSPIASAKKAKAPKLNKTSLTVEEGLSDNIKVKKNGFTIKSTKWSTSDKKVATVTKKGVVTGVHGELAGCPANIYAKVKAVAKGKKKVKTYTLKCKVTVIPAGGGEIDGGWVTCTNPNAIDDIKGAIDKEFNNPANGVTVETVALLASQVVAGTNYRALVRKTDTKKTTAQTTYAIVEINVDLDGNSSPYEGNGLTGGIFDSGIEAAPKDAAVGGWAQEADVKISDEYLAPLQGGLAKLTNWNYTPVAIVETQASTWSYKVICEAESKVSDPGDAPAYDIVQVAIDPATKGLKIVGSYHFSDGGTFDENIK